MFTIFWMILAFSHSLITTTGQTNAAPCGKTFKGKTGVVKTPNYPQNYPDDLECTWRIITPKGHTVKLSVEHFTVEISIHCSNDFLKVYDGGSKKANMIGKYCGGMRPFSILSTSNEMTLFFRSDSSVSFHGFRAKFDAVPNNGPTVPKTTQAPSRPVTTLSTTEITTTTAPPPTTATTTTPTTPATTMHSTLPTTRYVTRPTVSMYFVKHLKNVTVCISGSSCKLVCHVRGFKKKKVPVIQWTKDDDIVIKDDRPGIDIVRKKRRSRLIIRQASKNDSGLYGCHATDPISKQVINMYGKLEVEERKSSPTTRPKPPFIFRAKLNFTVNINEKIQLTCKANGSQPLSIRWETSDGESLRGRPQEKQYRSYYKSVLALYFKEPLSLEVRCIAENRYGRALKTGLVRVIDNIGPEVKKEKPVTITMASLNLTAKMDEKVVLSCAANGTSPVSMRWLIDNRYHRGKQSRNKNSYTSHYTLVVKKTTKVKCEAQNPYGIDARTGIITLKSGVEARKADPWDTFKPGKKMFFVCIVGGFVLLIFVIAVVCFGKRVVAKTRYKVPGQINRNLLTMNPIFERTENTYVNPTIEKLNIPRNNIEFVKDVQNGTFSRLFVGKMSHASRAEQDALVHVKVLKDSTLEFKKEAFEEEAMELATYDHSNVQRLVGVCVTGRPLCLIFESSDRGDLNQFLRDSGCSHYIIRERPNSTSDPDTKLSKSDQLCIAKQIAAGMQYLSTNGYDHRQLCSKNCMINKNMTVKVANMGLHSTRPCTSYGALDPIEKSSYPVRWLPFESVTSGIFTETTDVWSFGIVLWEIYSYGITPYYGMNNDEVIALIREGDILPLPKDCPREMYDLMQDCWNLVPRERPSFRFLHEKISALVTGVAV